MFDLNKRAMLKERSRGRKEREGRREKGRVGKQIVVLQIKEKSES